MINKTTNIRYFSKSDITSAFIYATQSVKIEPSEIGKIVYDILIEEKLREYLDISIKSAV